MKLKYLYRALYALIVAHMVHKIYCRATARYHVPLIAILLGLIGIDLRVKPVRYDEDGDVIEDDDPEESIWGARSNRRIAKPSLNIRNLRSMDR